MALFNIQTDSRHKTVAANDQTRGKPQQTLQADQELPGEAFGLVPAVSNPKLNFEKSLTKGRWHYLTDFIEMEERFHFPRSDISTFSTAFTRYRDKELLRNQWHDLRVSSTSMVLPQ